MYRESDLITCLYGLAGWRQNENPDYPTLTPSLTATASGLYFQDEHPLINIENLDQALKNYDAYTYPAYTTGADYAEGERVRYTTDGKVYEANEDLAAVPGVLDPGSWTEVNLFSQKLEALTRAASNKIASAMFTQKKLDGVTKSIFENVQLFSGPGDLMNKETKLGRFVGLEIRMKSQRDVSVFIKRIGTQFSLANPNFKLWIFHSSQSVPVAVVDMNLTRANAFQWTASDIILKYLTSDMFPGGVYYIGYYEDDLEGMAINRGYNFGAVPCGTCNNDLALYAQWTKFIEVTPFTVPAEYLEDIRPEDTDGPFLWDINVNQYVYTKNFGLNLDLTTGCDVTDFLCRENRLFTDAIIKQVAHDVLSEIAYSTRNNTIAKETRDLAHFALIDEGQRFGVATKLKNAIDAISFDFSNLSDICFPCNNKNGLTWATW